MVMQGTGVWAVTLFSDLNFRTLGRPDDFSHFGNPFFNVAGIRRYFRRHVAKRKEFFRVNLTVPDELIVYVAEEAPFDFDSGFREYPRLKS